MSGPKNIQKGLSSRFSITWWFCRFLKPQMRWCSLLGGRQLRWRHLKGKRRAIMKHKPPHVCGTGLQMGSVLHLCGPGASARSLLSAGSRYKPCCPRSPTRSTATEQQQTLSSLHHCYRHLLTFFLLFHASTISRSNSPSLQWRRNWRICSTSRSCGPCTFSSTEMVENISKLIRRVSNNKCSPVFTS